MASSAGGRAAMHRQHDPNFDSSIARSSTLRVDYDSHADDQDDDEMDEERIQAQKEMQMLDLGTRRREYVTTNDKRLPPELRVSKEQLLRERKVNEEGTDAARWYQKNKKELNAWNNISTEIAADHADREKLDELMGGQSHRARLNRDIKEQGGQEYGESSNLVIDDYPRRGRGGGNIGRGMQGRSGRGAPMHMPAGRGNGNIVGGRQPLMTPTGPKANRPLDPALDPDREYGYKSKRGGRTFTMSYSGGGQVRVNLPLGRGNTPNDARATMVGTTVRIAPTEPSKPKSEQSIHFQPPRAPQQAPVTAALNEQAFLRVMNDMTTKPTFNDHVQGKSKPAPASKAAALVDQPAKKANKSVAGEKKPDSTNSKSIETPAKAFQKLEARAAEKSIGAEGSIRLAPTHEFAFPPPVTKSGGKNFQGSNVSVHTDGVETAATLDSADFASQTSVHTRSGLDPGQATSVVASSSRRGDLAAKEEPQSRSNGLGIYVLPPAGYTAPEHKGDLITLDQGNEEPQTDVGASNGNVLAVSNGRGGRSAVVQDIMDEELDDGVQQTSLTPNSIIAPRTLEYHGARYVRADQITGQDLGKLLRGTRPATQIKSSEIGSEGTCPCAEIKSLNNNRSVRVAVTEGLNIGLRTLQENSGGSLLGEHNLPGRSQLVTEGSSASPLAASDWATGNDTLARNDVTNGLNIDSQARQESSGPSILGEHNLPGRSRGFTGTSSALSFGDSDRISGNVEPTAFNINRREELSYQSRPNQADFYRSWRNLFSHSSEKKDIEMATESAESSAPQEVAKSASLVSLKHAIPEAARTTPASPASTAPLKASNTSSLLSSKFAISEAVGAVGTTTAYPPSPAPQKASHPSSLTLSKYAMPEAVATAAAYPNFSVPPKSSQPSSLTLSKHATPKAPALTTRVSVVEPVVLPGPAEFSTLGQADRDKQLPLNTRQNRQDNQKPTSGPFGNTRKMPSVSSSHTDDMQGDKARQEAEILRTDAPNLPAKVSDPVGSKGGSSDTEMITSALAKHKFRFEVPLSSVSEHTGRKANSAVETETIEPRRSNPFGSRAEISMRGNAASSDKPDLPKTALPVHTTKRVEGADMFPLAGGRPLSLEERMVQAMRSGPQAGPVKFGSRDSTSSKQTKPTIPKSALRSRRGKTSDSDSVDGRPKLPSNLTTSKYAHASSASSFRKVRQQRADSDSEESEI